MGRRHDHEGLSGTVVSSRWRPASAAAEFFAGKTGTAPLESPRPHRIGGKRSARLAELISAQRMFAVTSCPGKLPRKAIRGIGVSILGAKPLSLISRRMLAFSCNASRSGSKRITTVWYSHMDHCEEAAIASSVSLTIGHGVLIDRTASVSGKLIEERSKLLLPFLARSLSSFSRAFFGIQEYETG